MVKNESGQVKNFFCIDLEEWYNASLVNIETVAQFLPQVDENVDTLLELLEQYNIKATFFALASVVEQSPQLIKKIIEKGHEIASHGYAHQLVYNQTPEEFRADVRKAKAILESLTQKKINGYRAPSWSITNQSLWALTILQEEGYIYDSSIFPFKNFLYGINEAPRFPYITSQFDSATSMIEIPPSTIKIAKIIIPFSGGFYFRALPYWFIRFCIHKINAQSQPVVMYIHPWEINCNTPHLKLSKRDAFIQYYGIKSCKKKLEKLFSDFSFDKLEQYSEIKI